MRKLAFLALSLPGAAFGIPLFDEAAPALDVELRGPLGDVKSDAGKDVEYDFVVVVAGHEVPVKVRVRGKSRQRVCDFPPLRLNFSAGSAAGSLFEGQDKLKLVTHCGDKSKDAGNVQDELLAYRLFNIVSPLSYRVRPLRVTYIDTGTGKSESFVRDAFLIESDEQLAERIDAVHLELPGVYRSKLDAEQAARVYVFQYLIGNTDWSLVKADAADYCCHNIDLFERDGETILVPYDFDLSGLVDASYARPDRSLGTRSVKVRRYRGYCADRDTLARALDQIVSQQSALLATMESPDQAAYLSQFFATASDRERLLDEFQKRCL